MYGQLVTAGTDQPLFIFLSDLDSAATNFDEVWDALRGPGFQALLAGSAHMSYSDYPLLLHDFAPTVPLSTLLMGTIDPNLALEISNRYLLAYFNAYLKGAPTTALLAIADNFPEVTFAVKNEEVQ